MQPDHPRRAVFVEVAEHCVSRHGLQVVPVFALRKDDVPERPGIISAFRSLGNLKDDLGRSRAIVLRVPQSNTMLSPFRHLCDGCREFALRKGWASSGAPLQRFRLACRLVGEREHRVGKPALEAGAGCVRRRVAGRNAERCTRSTPIHGRRFGISRRSTPPRRACHAAPLRTAASSSGRDQHDTIDNGMEPVLAEVPLVIGHRNS